MTIDRAAGPHSQAFVAFILDRQPSHALGRKEDGEGGEVSGLWNVSTSNISVQIFNHIPYEEAVSHIYDFATAQI
jgi:hypothetical protein